MSGWVHRFEVLSEATIAVAPTPTTLLQMAIASHSSLSGIITNTSLTQRLEIAVSESWDGSTRWATLDALNATQFAEAIEPQESRHFQFDTSDLRHVRLQGAASGAGLNAVVSVQQTHKLGVR